MKLTGNERRKRRSDLLGAKAAANLLTPQEIETRNAEGRFDGVHVARAGDEAVLDFAGRFLAIVGEDRSQRARRCPTMTQRAALCSVADEAIKVRCLRQALAAAGVSYKTIWFSRRLVGVA